MVEGRRKFLNEDGVLWLSEGEYGQDQRGDWYCRPPGGHTGCLRNHEVVEHEDQTITVSPSILITQGPDQWHGYLERGIWRTC